LTPAPDARSPAATAHALDGALAQDAPLAAVALGRALRAAGLPVTPDRSATFAASAALLPNRDRNALYWAARVSFVSSADQLAAFDAVFAAVVHGIADPAAAARGDSAADRAPRHGMPPLERANAPGHSTSREPAAGAGDGAGDLRRLSLGARASDAERLADVRLDELSDAELAVFADLVRRLALATPVRRARRARAARRGEHLDLRSTLRRSRSTGGDPVVRVHRRRRERPRSLVALLDVSGSMAPYARPYLLLLESATRAAHAEAFVFATRLTRVTRALREGRAAVALRAASAAAPDWAGGTRLGEAVRTFNDRFGRRGMARDAVVVVLSDGWERGNPALLAREMERLSRLAYRIVWVNPRVAATGFAPLTGGMAAALPFVDEFVSGHSVRALGTVVEAIGRYR